MKICKKSLAGKPEGKKQLGRSRRRWKVRIKIELRNVYMDGVDWIHLAQVRGRWLAVSCGQVNKPLGSIKDAAFIE
jgi:hypothetical protein